MKPKRLAPLGAALLLALASTACNKLKARDELNKGVAAFRNAQYQSAIAHFQTAVSFDPTLKNARLYLATAQNQLYIPGGESKENIDNGNLAIKDFEEVLKTDPSDETAIASIGNLYYGLKDFEKAKEWQRKRIQISPRESEPHYWIGMLDWSIVYPRRMALRKELKLTDPKDPKNPTVLPDIPPRDRADLAKDNAPLIDEGISELQKALELKPNDLNALTYLNLMYREKADIEATASARDEDLKQADDIFQKANALSKAQAEQAAAAVK